MGTWFSTRMRHRLFEVIGQNAREHKGNDLPQSSARDIMCVESTQRFDRGRHSVEMHRFSTAYCLLVPSRSVLTLHSTSTSSLRHSSCHRCANELAMFFERITSSWTDNLAIAPFTRIRPSERIRTPRLAFASDALRSTVHKSSSFARDRV